MARRKPAEPRAVVIRWVDAAMSTAPHWADGSRPVAPKGVALHLCSTIGWLVHLDDDWVQVVTTLTKDAHAHVTEIPRGMVRSITLLAEAGEIPGKD